MEEKENKRSFRARLEHKLLMLEEAEENPIIITMNFSQPNARAHYNKCWDCLTEKLNALGYGEKPQDKWRRVLIDWISATKGKYAKIKKDREKTGGGPHIGMELSSTEEKLMAIKGYTCVEGDAGTHEMGLLPVTTEASNLEIEPPAAEDSETIIIDFVQDSGGTPSGVKKRKKDHSSNTSSTKSIQDMHEETLQELKGINLNIKIISDCLVDISNTLKNNADTKNLSM